MFSSHLLKTVFCILGIFGIVIVLIAALALGVIFWLKTLFTNSLNEGVGQDDREKMGF